MSYIIMTRALQLINTDPQRRCYNGCHFSSEWVWSEWREFWEESDLKTIKRQLRFWTELNDYAVSQRGESAKCEYKIVERANENLRTD
jgi:hypothetical protein